MADWKGKSRRKGRYVMGKPWSLVKRSFDSLGMLDTVVLYHRVFFFFVFDQSIFELFGQDPPFFLLMAFRLLFPRLFSFLPLPCLPLLFPDAGEEVFPLIWSFVYGISSPTVCIQSKLSFSYIPTILTYLSTYNSTASRFSIGDQLLVLAIYVGIYLP